MKVFSFDPKEFKNEYVTKSFVHIPSGITPGFLEFARTFAHDALEKKQVTSLTEWAIKNKKDQFLFDFPETVNFVKDVKEFVGELAGLDREKVTLCERHIKVYNDEAPATPPPHKDRLASEVTVGIPLEVPESSYIVLYPQHYREINPFASTALHRASLEDNALPEKLLADVEPEVLRVWPGDVIFFKGSSIYHERVNPANTSLLYLKFNGMNLDPLGEDPATPALRGRSLQVIDDLPNDALLQSQVAVSPQLEKASRHYSRLYWKEIIQFTLWNQTEITITEYELALIKSLGHEQLCVADLLRRNGADGVALYDHVQDVRRLVQLGALNLVFPQS